MSHKFNIFEKNLKKFPLFLLKLNKITINKDLFLQREVKKVKIYGYKSIKLEIFKILPSLFQSELFDKIRKIRFF